MVSGTLQLVFRKPWFVILALVVSLVVFSVAVWLPNFVLIFQIIGSSTITLSDKVSVLWSLYGSIGTNFTTLSASYTIAIALLFGINIALLTFYIKSRRGLASGKSAVAGVGGLVSGIFGVGCAACGTFILSSLLGLVGAVGVLSFLPLGGEEFGILGVLLLVYSIYIISKKIYEPMVCEI